jgi:uncharacterized protein YjbI with pentapeptide repeats
LVAILEVTLMAGDREREIRLNAIPICQILRKISKSEPVEYNHARIVGDLDLRELDLLIQHIERTNFQKQYLKLPNEIKLVKSKIEIINSNIEGDLSFSGANLLESVDFRGSKFRSADFIGATFSGDADFSGAIFGGDYQGAFFMGSTFMKSAYFRGSTFSYADFSRATFSGEASFSRSTFSGHVFFEKMIFNGEFLTFRNAKFTSPLSQADACRRAKNVLAKSGIRDEEEYHFYREMEAKRIRKGIRGDTGQKLGYILLETEIWSFWRYFWYDAIEWLFVQMMFGYGVHFERLVASWAVIVLLFAGLYDRGGVISGASGWFDCLKVSFETAIAPGYIAAIINPGNSTGYKIVLGHYQAVAVVETLLGTFLWAGFIATFAKKYMR